MSHDEHGNRLTWLRVTGGEIKAKMVLDGDEKADQVRLYSGAKFTTVDELPAGSICAVTGLTHSRPGQGLGDQCDADAPVLQPVLTYTLLPQGEDPHRCLTALRELDDEDPLLHVVWQERLQEIHVQLMGAVQLEIIQQIMRDRFNLNVGFGPGSILYKETIAHAVEGIGHFEPLRHYAEAHVLLEPGEPGSGLTFATSCSEDVLARNWQRLILTHFAEKEHLGVLIGVPITDMKLTLLTGRAHEKHTEGGDFRQATYRAIRQGLMTALVEGDFSRHDLFDEDAAEDVAEDAAAADAKTARTDESEPSDGSAFASAARPRSRLVPGARTVVPLPARHPAGHARPGHVRHTTHVGHVRPTRDGRPVRRAGGSLPGIRDARLRHGCERLHPRHGPSGVRVRRLPAMPQCGRGHRTSGIRSGRRSRKHP